MLVELFVYMLFFKKRTDFDNIIWVDSSYDEIQLSWSDLQ